MNAPLVSSEPALSAVRTTCPYCGVGCGVIATVAVDGSVSVQGDELHPANFGRLCSKGSALGETVDLEGRLLYPEINGLRVAWEEALDKVADGFTRIIREHGPDAVAFYVSGQLLTEDYYIANKLMKGFIGSANIDTNSRLCMASSVAGHKRAFGADCVPCSYEDLELSELIVLTGSNAAWCHPVLFQRIRRAKENNPALKIIVIDPRRTNTCDIADLHLPLAPGSDAVLFNGLLSWLEQHGHTDVQYVAEHTEGAVAALQTARASSPSISSVAASCGLDEAHVQAFFQLFGATEKAITVYSQGINQSSSGTDKVNAIINCHLLTGRIGHPGMGPFSFTGQPNAMGGRESGGMANTLAAQMDIANPVHRERVQRFWQSPHIADKQGLKAVDLFQAIAAGKVKAVWIMATNPLVSLPDASAMRQALAACELVVVSDCIRHTDTTALAHVLLPALGWGEKSGTVTNSERCISRQRRFLPAPGQARADWWIIAEVAKRMGFATGFNFAHEAEIFAEHARLSGFENEQERAFNIAGLEFTEANDYEILQPIQWPVYKGELTGTARMLTNGDFFTPSRRAQFIAITPRLPGHALSAEFPLVLNTGRVRDHWHTLTRTGKSPKLSAHSFEPYVEMHPEDAVTANVAVGSLACVSSAWGKMFARCTVNPGQRKGSVFVPLHWNEQFASHGCVDNLVNPVIDPVSGQPESKHTPVNITPYQPHWHGFLLSKRKLDRVDTRYWVCAKGQGYWRYELAGDERGRDWAVWARQLLCASDHNIDWIEYFDTAAGRYRGARLVDDRLESCIFIAPGFDLPPRSWLMGLFEKPQLSLAERNSLLSGKPPFGTPVSGAVVCACFNVGINTITQAIQGGVSTVDGIGQTLKAGTNCGSCIPELKALLAQHVVTVAA